MSYEFGGMLSRVRRHAWGCVAVAALLLPPGIVSGQASFEVVRSVVPEPGFPWGRILLAADGAFYGTTYVGGPLAAGTIFRLHLLPDGSAVRTTIHTFANTDGRAPIGDLIQARDGTIYGTTCRGGAEEAGVIFKVATSGAYSLLHTFRPSVGEGNCPWAGLVEALDGNLFGTTNGNGPVARASVFRITPDGTFTTLHLFGDPGGPFDFLNGPNAALLQARDGHFYGTRRDSIFRITEDGTFETLHTFQRFVEGDLPMGSLVEAPNGDLYGTTTESGFFLFQGGNAFKITPGGEFTLLGPTPSASAGTLTLGSDGAFYGTSERTIFRMIPSGEVTNLHFFSNRELVYAGLIQAPDGTFYGTSTVGGPLGAGGVFKMASSGEIEYLDTFERNGLVPIAGLTLGTDGSFYGTSLRGGLQDRGTIFRMSPSGTLTTLFSFGGTDTRLPGTVAKLFQAADGAFYGVADDSLFRMSPDGDVVIVRSGLGTINTGFVQGRDGKFYGTNQDPPGRVLRIAENGELTYLFRFVVRLGSTAYACGSVAALVEGTDGSFYGSTFNCESARGGSIFRITADGAYTRLHSFGFSDGWQPTGALIEGRDGNFYGTTRDGGRVTPSAPTGLGTAFRMTPAGSLTTLHQFDVGEGSNPFAGLAEGEDGVFYGTTPSGGLGHGTLFQVDSSGDFEVVHRFTGVDGSMPYAPLTRAADGSLYGITPIGGTAGAGTIFRITPAAVLESRR